ncbi:hypothetical protein ABZT43_09405 [Streptomyces sp. NPDC005349]|uniref:hypothetical protein n=1 Tax=Streptomyces sp. NPDC005349 TaxID=3157037 RepID=UPI0033B2BA43
MTVTEPEQQEALFDTLGKIMYEGPGYMATTVFLLREMVGARSAKSGVVSRIEQKLSDRGIAHIPRQIPRDKDAAILLYRASDKEGLGAVIYLVAQLAERDPRIPVEYHEVRQLENVLNGVRATEKE